MTDKTSIVYAVGKNMPGYLPEGDIYYTLDYESAKGALIEDLDRTGDYYTEGADEENGWNDLADECSSAMEDLNLCAVTDANRGQFDAYIGDLHFWLIAQSPEYFGMTDDATLEAQLDDANGW